MIVPMHKTYVTARHRDRLQLLQVLGDLGVVHLTPVDPREAVPDAETISQVQILERALQILLPLTPAESPPELPAQDAAREVLDIVRRRAAGEQRLTELFHQLQQIELWGDVELEQLAHLASVGVHVQFCSVDSRHLQEIRADCVEPLKTLPGKRLLAALASSTPVELPPSARVMEPPPRDAPAIRAEAAEIDASLKTDRQRLAQLAHLVPAMQVERERLQQDAADTLAVRGAATSETLFAVQGWIPEEIAPELAAELSKRDLPTAVRVMKAADDEEPPTLVRPPKWTQPIEGLFSVMGTVPGYREFDVSIPFLLALPLFTAMLISDGGYGLVLLLGLLLAYRPATHTLGKPFTHLLMLVGLVALLWGGLCATFFGVTLYRPIIPVDLSAESRTWMMTLCFGLGALHLSVAQIWQAVRLFPSLRFLNRVGWAVFIWGMFGVVRMFVLRAPLGWHTPWPYLLVTGAGLAIAFHRPCPNPLRTLLWGIAAFPLSMMSAFSDVISYVRLMAVGMASTVLAVSFNELAWQAGSWPLAVLILVFGHSLNMGLAMIAMFAHGVRLNMLEFSNNLGMQWAGYPYRPFVRRSAHHAGGLLES